MEIIMTDCRIAWYTSNIVSVWRLKLLNTYSFIRYFLEKSCKEIVKKPIHSEKILIALGIFFSQCIFYCIFIFYLKINNKSLTSVCGMPQRKMLCPILFLPCINNVYNTKMYVQIATYIVLFTFFFWQDVGNCLPKSRKWAE